MIRTAVCLVVILGSLSSVLADDLILEDGRVLSGVTAKEEGEAWVVGLASGRLLLPRKVVHRHVTEEDAAGRKLVAAARMKEPSEFKGRYVVVSGRLAPHVGKDLAGRLDGTIASVAVAWGADPAELKPPVVEVPASPADRRRHLVHARAVVALDVLGQIVPDLAKSPFPLPALADLVATGDAVDGGMLEALRNGKEEDLAVAKLFTAEIRPDVAWSLVRFLAADKERFAGFVAVVKKGDTTAIREWLTGIEGLEKTWREHVKGWSLATAEQHVDAAYVAVNARNMRRAAALFEKSLELGSKERGAFDGLAEIHVLGGDSVGALRVWQAALVADPLNVRARRSIVRWSSRDHLNHRFSTLRFR